MNNQTDFQTSDLDGVVEFEAASLGLSPTGKNPYDNDNFYPADGGCPCGCGAATPCDFGDPEYMSPLLGGLIPSKKELQRNRARRQARKDIRTQSRAVKRVATGEAKKTKASAKEQQAKAQRTAASNIGKETSSDLALAAALQSGSPDAKSNKMSTGAIIGIVIASTVAIATGAFVIIRKNRKK